ncbi:MAG: hypothetical protein IKB22_06235, partial [Lentisphaeria bacterium]|nr:hypothetical protein [Lentisphaeria bacterium]
MSSSVFTFSGYVLATGNLHFLTAPIREKSADPLIDMCGHTASMDYTTRNEDMPAMIDLYLFSEDSIFQIDMTRNQPIGTYAISNGVRGPYHICVDGKIIGTIDNDDLSFVYGLYSYVMNKNGGLTIDIADDSDGTYTYVWYDTQGEIYHAASVSDFTIGPDLYPQMIVRKGGDPLKRTVLDEEGILKVRTGGQVIELDQRLKGRLRFNYAEEDSTYITGINPYGSFFVKNNVLENVYGENVTVSGNVFMRDYHGYYSKYDETVPWGTLTTENGVRITGTFGGGAFSFTGSFLKDFVMEETDTAGIEFRRSWLDRGELNGGVYAFLYGATATNSVFNTEGSFEGGSTVSDSVFNSSVLFTNGTISVANVVINGGYALGAYRGDRVLVDLGGDLTLNCAGTFQWNTCINVNGHTVTVNYKD